MRIRQGLACQTRPLSLRELRSPGFGHSGDRLSRYAQASADVVPGNMERNKPKAWRQRALAFSAAWVWAATIPLGHGRIYCGARWCARDAAGFRERWKWTRHTSALASAGYRHVAIRQETDAGEHLLSHAHKVAALLKRWLLEQLKIKLPHGFYVIKPLAKDPEV